ncbi:MAG: sulfite exporter TauE/SafE family protein, partial [Actinomycetes bacterium]
MIDYLVIGSFFVVALLYSSVGHAGASGYLAVMAIAGLMPEVMRPTALALNILVSSIVTYRFSKAGLIKWNKLLPLIITSIPFAFLGGTIKLPDEIYKPILGIVLIFASIRLFLTFKKSRVAVDYLKNISIYVLLIMGAILGLLSGLTGTGGGIFLTPLLLFAGFAGPRTAGGLSSAFILFNSISGLLGQVTTVKSLPDNLYLALIVVAIGGFIGSGLVTRPFVPPCFRLLLAFFFLLAGVKLI